MVGFERRRDAAVATAAAVESDHIQPLGRRIRTDGGNLSGTPQPSDDANDLGIRESVRGHRSLGAFGVSGVVVALVRAILLAMPSAPTAHRFAGFRGVSLHPIAAVGATNFSISMCHPRYVAGISCRDNGTIKTKARPFGRAHCCGETIRTSDLRVMSPSSYRCSTPRTHSTSNASRRRTRTTARSATERRSPCEPMRRSSARHAAR